MSQGERRRPRCRVSPRARASWRTDGGLHHLLPPGMVDEWFSEEARQARWEADEVLLAVQGWVAHER